MYRLITKVAKKTFTEQTNEIIKQTISSLTTHLSSFVSRTFIIKSGFNTKCAEKIIQHLDPVTYQKQTTEQEMNIYGEAKKMITRLKSRTSYATLLPEKVIMIIKKSYGDEMEITFIAPPASLKKVTRLFKEKLNFYILGSNTEQDDKTTYYSSLTTTHNEIDFTRWSKVITKPLSSVFIPHEQKNFLINYLTNWKQANALYSQYGITHKLGILLYGPPGTGKTTLAKSIAHFLNYDIINIPLSNYPNQDFSEDLNDRLDSANKNCIILLEDIDYLFSSDKIENETEVSAKANNLLQFLDGVSSASNVVYIATTNEIDKLKPAFIRDGRFDIKLFPDNISSSELAEEMVKSFNLDPAVALKDKEYPINPAQLQNECIQKVFDSLGATATE